MAKDDVSYSKNLNNRQTLAGFVNNYGLIYKIIQKHTGKYRKDWRGRRPRPTGALRAPVVVFSLICLVLFESFFRLSHHYQHPPGQGVSITMAFRVAILGISRFELQFEPQSPPPPNVPRDSN